MISNRLSAALSAVLLAGLGAACRTTTTEAQPVTSPATVVRQPFSAEVDGGLGSARRRADDLIERIEDLIVALETGTQEGAARAYCEARAPYEELQVLASAFPDLDLAIDGRPADFANGELDPAFRGFHRVEVLLFSRGRTAAAHRCATQLLEDARRLRAVLDERARFSAGVAFDGMERRCMDVATRIVSSEEEPWSNQSLLVIRHAWVGCYDQYRHFAGAVRERDALLAERIDRAYRQALEGLAGEFTSDGVEGSPYTLISTSRRRAIADASLKLRGYLVRARECLGVAPS